MSISNLSDESINGKFSTIKKTNGSVLSDWKFKSSVPTPNSTPPPSKLGERIFHNYRDLIDSKINIINRSKQTDQIEKPFDFFDDEEFAFGINILNKNVACVGDNITKLVQMAQEPWPDNVKLYQPYEVEQILLPDNASCLAVQAFLKMCNLPFDVEMRWNAEFMSPSGRVPFIKCGAFVVSELEPIVQFAANKGVTLCAQLSTEEKAEMRAYMSLITNVLVNAELYISWLDNDTYNAVTRVRNSSVYPWPLGWLQTRQKRNAVAKRLKALHWHEKSLDQVLADVEQCCNSLSQRLGDKDFFFGNTPTPIDALVSGHMRALLSASGPKSTLIIKPITSTLLRHVVRVVTYTGMMLTPQEEYLISQAFQVTSRRLSPQRTSSDRSTRMKRSKMSLLNPNRDQFNNRDIFGFKPFASKQITILTSKGGDIKFKNHNKSTAPIIDKETYKYIIDIIDGVLDKVDELIVDNYDERIDFDRNDFEIIAFPGDVVCIDTKVNDYLDTIEEIDNADTTVSIDTEEMLNENDSDGLVIDKMLAQENVLNAFDNDLSPTELDALIFGHVFTIITTRLPCRRLAETVRRHDTLVSLAKRIDERYFKRA